MGKSSASISANSILTMSVIKLSEMKRLREAYNNFGNAALALADKNSGYMPEIVTGFVKAAVNAERYPSAAAGRLFNKPNPSELVDLKCFAENCKRIFPELSQASDNLIAAIDNAVIYGKRDSSGNVVGTRGSSLNRGGGLSTYYPYNLLNSGSYISAYQRLADKGFAPASQGALYKKMCDANVYTGEQISQGSDNQGAPLNSALTPSIPKDSPFNLSNFADGIKVHVDKYAKSAYIKLNKEQMARIAGVRCQVAWFDYYEDEDATEHAALIFLGGNSNIVEDWNSGKFESDFNGKWLTINGKQLVHTQLISDSTEKDVRGSKIGGYELYGIPIDLNEELCILLVTGNYLDENCCIIGARPVNDSGLPSGALYDVKPGDTVKPVYIRVHATENDINDMVKKYGPAEKWTDAQKAEVAAQLFSLSRGKAVTVDENTAIVYRLLPDGNYAYAFEFINPVSGSLNSNSYTNFSNALFEVSNGKVSKVRNKDDVESPEDLQD